MLSVIRLNNKMVNRLKKLPYEIRLKRLGIYTQERRRLRGDLIETFKILTGKERIDYKKFFWISRCYQLAQRTFIDIIQAKMSHNITTKFLQHPGHQWMEQTPTVCHWSTICQCLQKPAGHTGHIWVTTDYSWHGYTTHQPQVQVKLPFWIAFTNHSS